jgi:hypothetical protein
MPACIPGDPQARIIDLKFCLASRMPTDMEEGRQADQDAQEQLKLIGEERDEYQDQVKRVVVLAGPGCANRGERTHNDSKILLFSRTGNRVHQG